MDISSILDSFEKQIGEQEKEVDKKTEKTILYGEWADFDLQAVIEEREKWKEQLTQQGILKNDKTFPIKEQTVMYSGNYVNRVLLNNCMENYKAMQCRYFERYYRSEIVMFPGCLIYIKKMMGNIVAENIRFIKIVLSELNLTWDKDLDREYLKYIEFDEVNNYFDNLGDMISQKIIGVAEERFEKRQSGNLSELWIGGEGIGGLIKGYVMGTAINFGVEKASDMFNKIGDSIAADKLRGKFNEVFEEIQKQIADLISMFADQISPFLMIKFQESNVYCWFDVCENNDWKQILDFANYEYEHNLIDDITYWKRLVYLLEEYPFVNEIYVAILNYDLDCMKELYMVAEFFGLGETVLGESSVCIAKLAGRYKDTSVTQLTEAEVYDLWDKYKKGIYNLNDIVIDDSAHLKKALNQFNMYKKELYKLLIADRTYFLRKREEKEQQEYTEETIEILWERVGRSQGINRIDASPEEKLWGYYLDKCYDFVEKRQIVQFEESLEGLITHLNDADIYRENCAKCLYAFFLSLLFKDIDSKKADAFQKDVCSLARRGIVVAKFFVALFSQDEDEREEYLLEVIQDNFPAEGELMDFYLEKFQKNKSVWDKACAERWREVEEYADAQ